MRVAGRTSAIMPAMPPRRPSIWGRFSKSRAFLFETIYLPDRGALDCLVELNDKLAKLQRYERRAFSRRNRALRAILAQVDIVGDCLRTSRNLNLSDDMAASWWFFDRAGVIRRRSATSSSSQIDLAERSQTGQRVFWQNEATLRVATSACIACRGELANEASGGHFEFGRTKPNLGAICFGRTKPNLSAAIHRALTRRRSPPNWIRRSHPQRSNPGRRRSTHPHPAVVVKRNRTGHPQKVNHRCSCRSSRR